MPSPGTMHGMHTHLMLLALLLPVLAVAQPARPPPFNPALDAPHTVGQPGHLEQPKEYPRSLYKRVLPPTKEKGLWAGERPTATLLTELLGVQLPIAKTPKGDDETLPTALCAGILKASMQAAKVEAYALRLSKEARTCIAAHLLLLCLEAGERNFPGMYGRAAAAARDFRRASCTEELTKTQGFSAIVGATIAAQNAVVRKPWPEE